jgi:MoaA/NifB/PqqE/SkfB family radical SAM enzyme
MKELNYNKFTFGPVFKRHWQTSWPYLNIRKALNILISKTEEFLGSKRLWAKPYFIKIEPTSRCNLNCPGCLHAKDKINSVDNFYLGDLDFELFKKIIDELQKYLLKVSLYVEGEPLIYPQIAAMAKYLSGKNIGSVISTNLNFMTSELAAKLVNGKLSHLIVCLDGYDNETYARYRQGGNFDKVIANIRLIQAEKKRRQSKYPLLEIQAINLPHFSGDDMDKIKNLTEELEADSFSVKENLEEFYTKPKAQTRKCFWLYSSLQLKWNGLVQPCCYYYNDKENEFGDLHNESVKQIWNNEKYQAAREYFKTGKTNQDKLRCFNCDFFKK